MEKIDLNKAKELKTNCHNYIRDPKKFGPIEITPDIPDSGTEKNPVESAVSIILFNKGDETFLTLFQRQEYDGHHSGEICLPGGRKERQDNTLIQTAIRETYEEIGWNLNNSFYIGEVPEHIIKVSNYLVKPYIFFKTEYTDYTIDRTEVDWIIEIRLKDLLNPNCLKRKDRNFLNTTFSVPYYDIDNYEIWGATARILFEFSLVTGMK